MKIMVTGGAGFIGSHIVDLFAKDHHELAVLDNLSTGSRENLPENITLYPYDIASKEARECLEQFAPDILIHTAAQISVRISMEDPVEDARVNILGLINLLQARVGKKMPHVVFTSTGGAIYGEQSVFPASETHEIVPECAYGLAKYAAECYLALWSRQYNLSYTVLRLANVYGPRQSSKGEAGVIAIFSERLVRAQKAIINGDGRQTRDFVFVEDVARAAKKAVEKRICGVFNIGTGIETSILEIYDLLRQALEVDTAAEHAPQKPGEQRRSSIDSSLAKKQLDWQPEISLVQGIKQTALWFKNRKN